MPGERGGPLRQMVRGSVWMVGARWSVRSIGLVSTVILARLLRPEDFGLVAMGAVLLNFIQVFANAGQELAIIRHPNPTREHFDTAWTMSVVLRSIVALALVTIAPLGGWYFHEPRAVPVIQVLALKPLINGFINIGVVNFRRDLRFQKEFQFLLAQKISTFVVTVVSAVLLHSYCALVIGNVSGEVINVIVSYRIHAYRPHFCLAKLRNLWSFSAWTQVASLGIFLSEQSDLLVIGGVAGAVPMGGLNVAQNLANSPTNELVAPPVRALYPVYATLLHDPRRLAESYLGVLSVTTVIALATGIGMSLVARDMVAVVLGPKWHAIAPLVPWLAVSGAVAGMSAGINGLINVTGNARVAATRAWLFVVLLTPAIVAGALFDGVQGVVIARTAATILYMPVMFYSLMRVLPITVGEIITRMWRPMGAALLMAAVVTLSGTEALTSVPLRLLCNVGLGAVTFAVGLILLWMMAGCPAGVERTVVDYVLGAAGRLNPHLSRTVRTPPP